MNTIIQYIQLVLNILIGLLSVRFILEALGKIDYGIYSLIGGVIGLLGFIRSSLSQTSIRYISVSVGKKNNVHTTNVFNSCFWLHSLMGLVLVCLFELAVPFLFNGFLNIPAERMAAAQWTYQCMILSLLAGITVTPFSALIIAHEKFVYTSIIAIFDSIAKLGIAICLLYYGGDKLYLYALLMAIVIVINFFAMVGYCVCHYKGMMSFRFTSLQHLRSVATFAGWTLLDVLGTIVNRQGYAILLNKFFGPVCNTTFAIARQIDEHLYRVSASVIDAMKPQIMKSYGAGNEKRMFRLSLTAGKFGFSMMALVTIPLMVMLDDVLVLWLGKNIPEDAAVFTMLIVIACMAEQLTRGLVYANQAVGNIKWFSIVVSSARILCIPFSILVLMIGYSATVALSVYVAFETTGSLLRVFVLSKISNFNSWSFFSTVFLHIMPPAVVATLLSYYYYSLIPHTIVGMGSNLLLTSLSYMALIYMIGMTDEEKSSINGLLKNFTRKIFKKNEQDNY